MTALAPKPFPTALAAALIYRRVGARAGALGGEHVAAKPLYLIAPKAYGTKARGQLDQFFLATRQIRFKKGMAHCSGVPLPEHIHHPVQHKEPPHD